MKNKIIILKLILFILINLWLIYLISTRIELEKICITSDWLNYLMNFLEIENPTINVQLLVLFGVFVIFCIVFGIFLKLIRSVRIGVSILMVLVSKYLYKVHDKFLTCGEDISFLGLTMEHVMSVKEKLTLLKDYIKTNNIVIDNFDLIVVWEAIKPLKQFDEVMEMIKQLVEELKPKELSFINLVYNEITVQNAATLGGIIIFVLLGLSIYINLIKDNLELKDKLSQEGKRIDAIEINQCSIDSKSESLEIKVEKHENIFHSVLSEMKDVKFLINRQTDHIINVEHVNNAIINRIERSDDLFFLEII